MTRSVRVLYLAPDAPTGDRLESVFDSEQRDVTLSAVASADAALAALGTGEFDHVVVDSTADAESDASTGTDAPHETPEEVVRREAGDVPVTAVDAGSATDDRPPAERVRVLARRIRDAVADENGAAGDVADGHFRALAETLSDAILVIDTDSVVRYANPAVADVFGYEPSELVGGSLTTLMPDGLANRHREGVERFLRGGDRHVDWSYVELVGRHRDGGEIPLGVSFSAFVADGELRFTGIVRDVTEQKRRERRLASLNELLQSLAEAETETELAELAVDAAVETLDLPNAVVARYDDETGRLTPAARRWRRDEIDDALLGRHGEDVAWQTFVASEPRTVDDLSGRDADAEAGSAIAVPLGKYGVFLAAAPDPGTFDETDRSLTEMLCANVRSALDRIEREQRLRAQRNDLEETARELERAERINRVVRRITTALTRASSKEEVMQAVCDRLTEAGPYRFAWFGTLDRATDEIRPDAWAGVEDGYLDEITVSTDEDEPQGRGPVGRAVRTEELQIQNDLLGDPPFEPWREKALKRGYRSSASIPVSYEGTLRGVLNLYAGEPGVFDETERTVLAELGEAVGYALNAFEQERALASERSTELDFRVDGTDSPVLAFVAETGAEFEFESAVRRSDGRLHAFFTVRDADPSETLAYAEDVSWIEDVRLVTDRDGESLYDCALADDSFLQSLVNRGAMPRTLTATEAQARFVVRVPENADVREIVDLFEGYYDTAELVARRERDEPVTTRQDFESELTDRLTDRQREVLRTAYASGFFEWPRASTAEEVADLLDVSQPTVSRHIRASERSLFGLLFDE